MKIEKEVILALKHIDQKCIDDLVGCYLFSWSNNIDYTTSDDGFRISLGGIEEFYSIMPECLVFLCDLALWHNSNRLLLLTDGEVTTGLKWYDINYGHSNEEN
jgi:hypothetical protein